MLTMKKSSIENGFIIDLSNTKNTTQLVFELSSIMEHPDVTGKNVCLKLGGLDLKQSQLLSIKALIESMNASIAFIDTESEQTRVSAESLGIKTSSVSEECSEPNNSDVTASVTNSIKAENITDEENSEEPEQNNEKESVVEVFAEDSNTVGHIETKVGIDDMYNESTASEISEVVPIEKFAGNDFGTLAASEGLLPKEESSKYIILDTGNVLPDGIEENSTSTNNLPTLYLNQTLRSGQTVSYEGNIFIVGDAHPGSEIIASGDITVWGILGGIAHAGNLGNISAKVRALKLNAIQLRIAGLYARRNDTLNVPYVHKSDEFTPEEAQIENGKIVIYKKLRRD